MIRNEKIAEKMGWVGNYWGSLLERRTPDNDIVLAKILQQRMVDDGWDFHLSHLKTRDGLPFRASAHYDTTRYFYVGATTEPLAIFELFCRVYGIPASE